MQAIGPAIVIAALLYADAQMTQFYDTEKYPNREVMGGLIAFLALLFLVGFVVGLAK